MGKTEKLISKLLNSKKTFDWSELVNLLSSLGYQKKEMEGSRVRFIHPDRNMILLHRPHPENHIKGGALKAVKTILKDEGIL
ncbi:type II toxin-antitoxin system HicA family toxin [Salmonella enterica subsp. enterica serovar Montevideo]|nr:type II toxin-antitoxin system HicA family toxin [Salmonella enterica subsp. enterica serovar Montevideo]EEK7813953.1 type II toxin-antitoxin system HicA family toxin [Salmonella enterica subsp. enterica serovar Montevideo]EEL0143149.1 type II toxin-antitoxin system HicA family toxin [Salmonella enterica subsp. enterica serovar Montevideo]